MSVLRGLAINYMEKYGLMLVGFGSSIILARFLSPDDTGIFSVGMFVISLAHTVRDLGVSSYIIQEKELTIDRLRSAQFVTLAMSWLMAICLAVLSGPVSAYYAEPQVREIMLVLVINFILLPFGSITMALLKRNLEFGKLSSINVVSSISQAVTSVTLAYYGHGAMSLAWGGVVGSSMSVALSMLCRKPQQPWLPGTGELGRVLDKGVKFSGAGICYDIGQGAPELISAKLLSFHDAGLLSRGVGAVMLIQKLFVDAVYPVMLSHFAQVLRNQPQQFREKYLASCVNLATLAWPVFGCFAVVSGDVILVLYGEAWADAAVLASILCIGAAVGGLSGIASSVLVGGGEAGISFKLQLAVQSSRAVLALIGAGYGIAGVAAGMAVADVLGAFSFVIVVGRKYDVEVTRMVNALVKPVCAAVVITSLTLILRSSLMDISAFSRLVIIAVVVTAAWFALLPVVNRLLWDVLNKLGAALLAKVSAMVGMEKK
ncbi:oligosaccharide flippase family protein [Zoogloea sp.]|uniref:oligosaccharide flippase family protein n=1 Tax=Zoogloea sp. TaxID=49181 RepID=UPI00261759F2|nr:oligosaccharide flippase family protein [Zoogloea sp.]MDD3352552.1 oligosaccharide flippase family protein [Zoogloea sp.]